MASAALPAAAPKARAASIDPPSLALFLLMSAYGPALGILGEFRYVEIAVLAIVIFSLAQVWNVLGKWDKRLGALFLLTAFAQLVSDYVNDAELETTLKRVGTYVIIVPLYFGVKYLVANKISRLRWLLLGYGNSYLIAALTGFGRDEFFVRNPWRLGLGFGVTLAVVAALSMDRRLLRYAPAILIGLAVIDILLQARSDAILTFVTAMIVLWANVRGSDVPPKQAITRQISIIFAGLLGIAALYQASVFATQAELFPEVLQKKMEVQFSSEYGILAAGRPDTVAAAYAVTKRPFLGFGSSGFDYDVMSFYDTLAISSYALREDYLNLSYIQLSKELLPGIPNHSHLLGAWVDAGIVGPISWFAVLWLCFLVGGQVVSWRHPLTPLFAFVAVQTAWVVLFSPGPHRMEIAIRLCVLTIAIVLMAQTRAAAQARRVARPMRARLAGA